MTPIWTDEELAEAEKRCAEEIERLRAEGVGEAELECRKFALKSLRAYRKAARRKGGAEES